MLGCLHKEGMPSVHSESHLQMGDVRWLDLSRWKCWACEIRRDSTAEAYSYLQRT